MDEKKLTIEKAREIIYAHECNLIADACWHGTKEHYLRLAEARGYLKGYERGVREAAKRRCGGCHWGRHDNTTGGRCTAENILSLLKREGKKRGKSK